ncbi:MAG: hypothetical protein WCT77_02960 [Bacteroidota bacterium]|jgi:hypothetical protein
MAKTNLYTASDLISFAASKCGFSHNGAQDILAKDNIFPQYEIKKKEYYLSELGQLEWSNDTELILSAFFEQEGIRSFTLIND